MARKKTADDRTVTASGYVLVWQPEHHLADIRGYVYEHRLIAEMKIGRGLKPGEHVHHVDGNKQNNAPENLVVARARLHRFLHRKPDSKLRLPDENNPVIHCACRCGQTFRKYDSTGRPRIYISGHNGRRHG